MRWVRAVMRGISSWGEKSGGARRGSGAPGQLAVRSRTGGYVAVRRRTGVAGGAVAWAYGGRPGWCRVLLPPPSAEVDVDLNRLDQWPARSEMGGILPSEDGQMALIQIKIG
ncbi:hypothetical protein GCM10010502_32120 [Kitasatospora aureofaciens]|uniref:Uncharacterized protein n=1 Tax=Kitasatospora aureofaciens TaxID=1894 RepID=A0A8H9HN13_KITAU|nr:hypothetical protein GCM10010502_32120 [Kitasatospora aureofaciens]